MKPKKTQVMWDFTSVGCVKPHFYPKPKPKKSAKISPRHRPGWCRGGLGGQRGCRRGLHHGAVGNSGGIHGENPSKSNIHRTSTENPRFLIF